MSGSRPPSSLDVRELLDRERIIPPLPASVRARAVARARASLVTGGITSRTEVAVAPRGRWGFVLAAAGIASAAVGTTAYEIGTHGASTAGEPPSATAAAPAPPSAPSP